MVTTRTKKIAVGCVVGLFVLGLMTYGFLVGCHATNVAHQTSAQAFGVGDLYRVLRTYEEANGRWPEDPMQAATERRPADTIETRDPISHRPLLYYPDAKPGSKKVLLAVPVPVRLHVWPFVIEKRPAILADGTHVDLGSAKPEDDRSVNLDSTEDADK